MLRCLFIIFCVCIVLSLGTRKHFTAFTQISVHYPLVINEVMVNNRNSIRAEDGNFEGWVEIYNKGDKAINLEGFGLSNDSKQPFLWAFPNAVIEPKNFCTVWTSGKNKLNDSIHTNFKLENKDKVIILTAPNETWKDIFMYEPMGENISYGRSPDGSSNMYGFDEGTPGKPNSSEILIKGPQSKRLEKPSFSCNGGFYTKEFDITLTSNDVNTTIYYTLDGTIPTKDSEPYTKSIKIPFKNNGATVVRARVYKDGWPKSDIMTQSYFVDKNIFNTYDIPVISIVTDPKNLFGYEKGIFIAGKIMDRWKMNNPNSKTNQITPANYNQRGKNWEREASIELFEPDGTIGLVQNIGIRTYGGYSRAGTMKSLSLFARKNYDEKECFNYDFFHGKAKKLEGENIINKFSRILLRTSATDSKYAFFRDALTQSLIEKPILLDIQASNPCIAFVNGEYYGIYNIREAYDKKYIRSHYDIDEEDVVIIKNPTGVTGAEIQEGYAGDDMHYNRMITHVKENDIKKEANYDYIKTQMDIDNFIEYNVLQIYCDNRDWPGNNVRIWRKRIENYNPNSLYGQDGRWRWMTFDLDYGFGLYMGQKAAENNSLKRATEKNGPDWPNPPWSTLLLRSLLENKVFRDQFINTFADRLNSIFLPEAVLDKIQAMEEMYEPYVKDHIKRWNLHKNSIENWKEEINILRNFAIKRPEHVRQHIIEYFSLRGLVTIRVEMNEGGSVKINTLAIREKDVPWDGIYFMDIPIIIKAVAEPGFKFIGWEGINESKETITITPTQSLTIKAVFKKL